MFKKQCFVLLVLVLFIAPSAFAKPYELKWPTAPAGSVMQVIGTAILNDLTKAYPEEIAGSIMPGVVTTNLMGIGKGLYNVAFSLSDTTGDAWMGEGYFKDKIRNFSNVATLYPHMSQIVVRADSGINSIEDLKGKSVSPASKGLSNDVEMLRLLKLYGIGSGDLKIQYVNFNDAAQQFNNHQLDCLFFTTVPVPMPPIMNVASVNAVKFLPIPKDKIRTMIDTYKGIVPVELPANIYKGQTTPVPGIGITMHIVARNDVPDDVVYKIVKTVSDNLKKYQAMVASMKFLKGPDDLAQDVGIPLHPGAKKFYVEKGWVK